MNRSRTARLVFALASFTSACASPTSDLASPAAATSQAIVGGEAVDYAFPGIGLLTTRVGYCTASLIGPNSILTAAHCFDYGSQTDQELAGFFAYATGADGDRPYAVDVMAYQSLPGANEDDDRTDLAVALLAENIAGDFVPPFGIATSFPAADEDVDIFGYGCDDPSQNSDTGLWDCPLGETPIKREIAVPWDQWNSDDMTLPSNAEHPIYTSHGDSGGPVLVGDNVIAIVSGSYARDGSLLETFGNAYAHYDWIEDRVFEYQYANQ